MDVLRRNDRPALLALTAGDPSGIGPEIVAKCLERDELFEDLRLVVLGPAACRPDGVPLGTADRSTLDSFERAVWVDSGGPERFEVGQVRAESGRAALDALRAGHQLALDGLVEGLVTAPVNKEALHLAGEQVEGQTQLLGRWCNAPNVEMLAVAGQLRVLLLTRHLPLAEAIASIRTDRVTAHLHLLDATLRELGIAKPRIALAGLNPHAGENGLLGKEDGELLAPAVRDARAAGLDVSGPESPDTVFIAASRGVFDGVLALYHDQAFIPVKLLDPDGGLTLLTGLPYLRVSPAHGTAFDIAGQGRASEENLAAALRQTASWARNRRS